jgi:hypothetical protein
MTSGAKAEGVPITMPSFMTRQKTITFCPAGGALIWPTSEPVKTALTCSRARTMQKAALTVRTHSQRVLMLQPITPVSVFIHSAEHLSR